MSSLAELVEDLPARVHRVGRVVVNERPLDDRVYERWITEMDAEIATRSTILPCERPPRRLDPDAIREGALADLVIEKHRRTYGRSEVGPAEGPAPATRTGLRDTLRSFLNAQEPCDRYDALIRHAAVALMLAEEISAGRA